MRLAGIWSLLAISSSMASLRSRIWNKQWPDGHRLPPCSIVIHAACCQNVYTIRRSILAIDKLQAVGPYFRIQHTFTLILSLSECYCSSKACHWICSVLLMPVIKSSKSPCLLGLLLCRIRLVTEWVIGTQRRLVQIDSKKKTLLLLLIRELTLTTLQIFLKGGPKEGLAFSCWHAYIFGLAEQPPSKVFKL